MKGKKDRNALNTALGVNAHLNIQNNCFDVIRLIAALSVVTTHLCAWMPPRSVVLQSIMRYFNTYFYGVVTFFAISGFLIPKSIEKSKNLACFLKKRMLRLYPGIWCAFLVSFLIIMILYRPSLTWKQLTIWISTQLTFFQVYTPDWLRGYGNGTPNGALWTIVTELQLYIVAWIFVPKLKKCADFKWGIIIVSTVILNGICWAIQDIVPHIVYRLIYVSCIPYLYIYLIGMYLYFKKDTVLLWLSQRWKLVVFLYTIIMTVFYLNHWVVGFYTPIHIGLTLPVMIITVAYGLGKHRLKYEISFGIYLFHFIFINAMIQLGVQNNLAIPLVLVLSIAMGFIQNIVIEKHLSKIRI